MLASGLFKVDEQGRIWRIATRHGRGVRPGGGYYSGAKITPCEPRRAEYRQRQGYQLVAATIDGRKMVTGAHRLVWARFNGPIPDGLTINHKNGVKDDNRLENLELATYSEQRTHALEVLKVNRHQPKGSLHPKTRLKEEDVLEIRARREDGEMVKDIAADFDMSPKAVSKICTRRTWTHI